MEPKIKVLTLVVNEASIKNNKLPNGNFKMNPTIQRKIGKLNTENNYFVEVRAEMHSTPENPFPIELVASVTGIVTMEGDSEYEINEFLKVQGFQTVFPHLRALVASMTSNALMPTILLPIVFPEQLIDNNDIRS